MQVSTLSFSYCFLELNDFQYIIWSLHSTIALFTSFYKLFFPSLWHFPHQFFTFAQLLMQVFSLLKHTMKYNSKQLLWTNNMVCSLLIQTEKLGYFCRIYHNMAFEPVTFSLIIKKRPVLSVFAVRRTKVQCALEVKIPLLTGFFFLISWVLASTFWGSLRKIELNLRN